MYMKFKKYLRLLIKFTLLDELVGFLYWALALYGLYLIANKISDMIFLMISLLIYIVLVSIGYILFLKRLKVFFKNTKH